MDEHRTPEYDQFGVAWDIAMALRRERLYRGRNQPLSLDEKLALAHRIMAHLAMAGVLFSRTPPVHGHGRRPDEPSDAG